MKDFLASFGLELVLLAVITAIIWIGLRVKKKFLKHLLFNLSAVFIALLIYEFALTLAQRPQTAIALSDQYYTRHSDLGYGVRDGAFSIKATKSRIKTGANIYDATYSFSEGRRVTPNADTSSQHYGLFLGGSSTFGEGVRDKETLPYYYNEGFTEKLNIRNYGVSGYGTHQVYTLVKNQIAIDTALLEARSVDVFYWFINPHIARVNGFSSWDKDGPRYVLENGNLKLSGTFREANRSRPLITKMLRFIWANSATYNGPLKARLSTGEEEVNLFLELVKETDGLLKEQGFSFTVLIQDMAKSKRLFKKHHEAVMARIKSFFEANDIRFIDINEAILQQGLDINSLKIEGDGHPTAEFNKHLAEHLWMKSISTPDNSQKINDSAK